MKNNADLKRKRILMKKVSLSFVLIFLVGCSCATPNTSFTKKLLPPKKNLQIAVNKYIVFRVVGTGVAPCENMCNMAEAKVLARRAAILNAYEELAEKIYGIEINGEDKIKNMMSSNNQISANVKGLVKGAVIENEDFKNGIYYVTMSVKLNAKNWNNNLNIK